MHSTGHWTFLVVAGVLVLQVEPLFQVIGRAGICHLVLLAVQALRSAVRGECAALDDAPAGRAAAWNGWRQGFLPTITHPEVLGIGARLSTERA